MPSTHSSIGWRNHGESIVGYHGVIDPDVVPDEPRRCSYAGLLVQWRGGDVGQRGEVLDEEDSD